MKRKRISIGYYVEHAVGPKDRDWSCCSITTPTLAAGLKLLRKCRKEPRASYSWLPRFRLIEEIRNVVNPQPKGCRDAM